MKPVINSQALTFRRLIQLSDIEAIADIVQSSGFFSAAEIDLACDLAKEKIASGETCSYKFLFAEIANKVRGYTCFGLIPATAGSYDLYWIAVDSQLRRRGIGQQLMQKTEDIIRAAGGINIYVETSSRPQYQPTHRFYESCGYVREAFLENFYAAGDGKIIFSKKLQ